MATPAQLAEEDADAAKQPLSRGVRDKILVHLTNKERARADNALIRSMWRDAAREHMSRSGITLPPNSRGPYLTRRVREMLYRSLESRRAPQFNPTGPDPGVAQDIAFNEVQAQGDAQGEALRASFAGAPIPVVPMELTGDDWRDQGRNTREEAALAELADPSNHDGDLADALFNEMMGDLEEESSSREGSAGDGGNPA